MPTRKTNQEFLEELKQFNPYIIPLEEYKNNYTKIKIMCKIHNEIFYTNPRHLIRGRKSCPKCKGENKKDRMTWTNEYFLQMLADKNIDVIPLEEYAGSYTKILFLCSCGRKWKTTPNRVLKGCHCVACQHENMKGDKNPSWNPNISQEDREIGIRRFLLPNYKNFIKSCFVRDNWTCQITGTPSHGDVVVHHINGYNWDVKNRTNINNGITLNENIHKEFHKIYGKGDNTKEQFIDFVQNLYKQNRISLERLNSLIERVNKIE